MKSFFPPVTAYPIKSRQCFEVNGRLFKTIQAAAKSQAWSMIARKYGDPQQITRVLDMTCDCIQSDTKWTDDGFRFDCCQLHERTKSGYFRRLHDRLEELLLKKYISQLDSGAQK